MMIVLILAGGAAFLASMVAVPEALDRAAMRKRAEAEAVARQERKTKKQARRALRGARRQASAAEQERQAAAAAETARIQANPEQAAHQVTQRFIPQRDDLLATAKAAKKQAARLNKRADRLEGIANDIRASLPDWLCNPGLRRSAILAAPYMLGFVVVANLTLDFLIFKAIFPPLVAALVTPLTVVGVALFGAMLMAGLGGHVRSSAHQRGRRARERDVVDRRPIQLRRLLLGAGLLGTFGLLLILALVAPYRSAGEHQQKVDTAQSALQTAEGRAHGDRTDPGVQAATSALNQAEADKAEAANMDRGFVVAGAAAELALVEFTLLASPLLELSRARREADEARAHSTGATEFAEARLRDVKRAEQTFGGDIAGYLLDHDVVDAQGAAHRGVASALAADAVNTQLFDSASEHVGRASGTANDDAGADSLVDEVDRAAAEAVLGGDPVEESGEAEAQPPRPPTDDAGSAEGEPAGEVVDISPSRLDDLDVAS